MERFLFKQACVIGGKEFANNKVQEVPEELLSHPHFQTYMKAGLIVEPSGSAPIKAESAEERGQRLADRFAKAAEEKRLKAHAEMLKAQGKESSEGGEAPEGEIEDHTGEVPPVEGHDEAPEGDDSNDSDSSDDADDSDASDESGKKHGKAKKSKNKKHGK